ncbi:MAG: hypothetical protein FJ356_00970 [Thaumarchaeota archaeon]|nr:hypothetical protein [Nitrososphaerota archaeon]
MRFTMLGIALIFAGFLILGIFGSQYMEASIQAQEFGDCFDYNEDTPPAQIDCNVVLQDKLVLTGVIVGLIAAGIVSLIKGVKGKWDQDVKPQDMLGP